MAKFDLENFPTRESAKRMMTRISPIYDNSYVAKWIFEVMGFEIDLVRSRYDELRLQAFPETATWGLAYWEQKYGIPINESLDVETRRKNIILRMGYRAPMNPCRVEKIVESICNRPTTVIENVAPYTFRVVISGGGNVNLDVINRHLRKMIPSHIKHISAVDYKSQNHICVVTSVNTAMVYTVTPDINKHYTVNSNLNTTTSVNTAVLAVISK